MVTYIQQYGNQLALVISGVRYLAVPTGMNMWIIDMAEPGPGPGPGPSPTDETFDWPFNPNTEVTSEYGARNGRVHQGIDFGKGTAIAGAAVKASAGGTIYNDTQVYHAGFGWHVIINHGVVSGRQLYTLYAHMLNPSTYLQGNTVVKTAQIGVVNNTGSSQGSHLHWETHIANPGGGPTWTNPGTHVNPRTFMATYQNVEP